MKVLLTGGGTGGHVCPALAVADALREAGHTVLFAGTQHGLEARVVPAAGYSIAYLPSRPLDRKLSPAAVLALGSIGLGVVAAHRLIAKERPAVVASTGGYAGAALAAAAAVRRTPMLLFEPNAIPGRTNLLLARWAQRVAIAYPACAPYFGAAAKGRVVVTGTPVRPDIGRGDRLAGRRAFGLDVGRFTLLVVGGSGGARSLNQTVLAAAPALLDAGLQILHQTGRAHLETVKGLAAALEGRAYVPAAYLDNMGDAYAAADLIVCRSGASTMAEVTACGLPAILVPFPFAVGDHQTHNARVLADAGAGVLIADRALTPEILVREVLAFAQDPDRLRQAGEASRSLARPEAAREIVRLLEEMAR